MTTNALAAIAAVPPQFGDGELHALLKSHYGLAGGLAPLVSERDQNLRVACDDGRRFVLKIASSEEDPLTTDFQVQALLHLAARDDALLLPRVQPTLAGDLLAHLDGPQGRHCVRLVSWVPGEPMGNVPTTPGLAAGLGEQLAVLGKALQDFEHAGSQAGLLWNMKKALQLRSVLTHIRNAALRTRVTLVLDQFERDVVPLLHELRAQVIHGDANPDNVMLAPGNAAVHGFIDFGDMSHAPLVFDVAIAASYLRSKASDSLSFVAPFVAAYHEVRPLGRDEIDLLYVLLRTRLATSIAILYWRLDARAADDAYRQATLQRESSAEHFLERLDALGHRGFRQGLGVPA